jgi:hypothetical protein
LETGDIPKAAAAFDCIGTASSMFSIARKGYYLSLEIRIRLARRAGLEKIAMLVSELEAAHCQLRAVGHQDFESYALFLGLCHIGQPDRGAMLLRDYISNHRRPKWPLPPSIRYVLQLNPADSEIEKELRVLSEV